MSRFRIRMYCNACGKRPLGVLGEGSHTTDKAFVSFCCNACGSTSFRCVSVRPVGPLLRRRWIDRSGVQVAPIPTPEED